MTLVPLSTSLHNWATPALDDKEILSFRHNAGSNMNNIEILFGIAFDMKCKACGVLLWVSISWHPGTSSQLWYKELMYGLCWRWEASLTSENPVTGPNSGDPWGPQPQISVWSLTPWGAKEVYVATGGRLDSINLAAFMHLHKVK